ncbi:MAG: hypothetical protein AAGK04_05610 [Planctomycetota bacterium]
MQGTGQTGAHVIAATDTSSNGLLTIRSGGQVLLADDLVIANNDANGVLPTMPSKRGAIVDVDGAGSLLRATRMDIGGDGNGEVTVRSGATLEITGAGITTVGTRGAREGALTIESGGQALIAGSVDVWSTAGAGASVNVTGPTSTLQIAGGLNIGDTGLGTVTVSNGATLDVQSSGLSILSGNAGDGVLNINSGGSAVLAGTLTFDGGASQGGNGRVNLNGGSLTLGNIFQAEPDADFNFTSGRLTITGDIALTDSTLIQTLAPRNIGFINGGGTSSLLVDGPRTFEFLGDTTLEGNAYVLIDGGSLTFGDLTRTAGADLDLVTGSLELRSDQVLNPARFTDFGLDAQTLVEDQTLRIAANATLQTDLTLNGGTFFAQTLTNGIDNLNLISGELGIGQLIVGGGETFFLPQEFNSQNLGVTVNDLTVSGVMVGEADIGGALTVAPTGTVRVTEGESLVFRGQSFAHSNTGRIEITELAGGFQGPASFEVEGSLTNQPAGAIDLTGFSSLRTGSLVNAGDINVANATSTLFASAGLTNAGAVLFSNSTATVFGDVQNDGVLGAGFSQITFNGDVINNDRIAVSSNSLVTFSGDVTNNSDSGFTVAGGATALFFGEYSGAGIGGLGTVQFEGLVNIGFSPFAAEFGGDITLGALSETLIELGGTARGAYDSLHAAGAIALGGELAVDLINGFELGINQRFLIFEGDGVVTGLIGGLAEGELVGTFGGVDLFISYLAGSGDDVALYTIPSPSGVGIAAVGLLAAGARRRR